MTQTIGTTAPATTEEATEEASRQNKKRKKESRAKEHARQWATIDVAQSIDFRPVASQLPFPADPQDLEFDATFDDVGLKSKSSLTELSKFYRTEMAKRGWSEKKKKRKKKSIEITFTHGQAEVELVLDQRSDGVEIELDCEGLSFEGTNDPAGLDAMGIPQPRAYLFLQKEFKLPADIRDLEFDGGNRCLFKSNIGLQETFDQLGQQLQTKGYRESRQPIVTAVRRYTRYAKGRVQVSVNIFSNESGSRAILEYQEIR